MLWGQTVKTRNQGTAEKILWVNPIILDTQLYREFLINIMKQLTKMGHDSSLIAVRSKNKYQNEDPKLHITTVPLRYFPVISPSFFAFVILLYLPIYIVKSKPKFVIFEPDMAALASLSSLFVSKLTKTKFILDIRSVPVESKGLRGFLFKFWYSSSILTAKRMFQGITIITPLMKEEVCKNYLLDPRKVGVWTCGASPVKFNPNLYISQRNDFRAALNLSKKFVVFYHGVMSATRGLNETIKAIAILKKTYPDIVFFLLGNGPNVQAIKELIQAENLQENVILHDPVPHDEVPKFILASDVCIVPLPNNPYWRFQCPVKLLEYLAMEKVIIASDIPAHRSIVENKNCVIYIHAVQPEEIAKAIEYAYENRDKLAEWGKSGRAVIIDDYSIERVAQDLESYLRST